MATIIINYNELAKIDSYAKKAADAAKDYANDLSNRASSKIGALTGGATSYTSSAKYYVDAKIKALNEKNTSFSNFSKQVQTLSETAKRVDGDVKSLLASGQNDFYKTHEDLKIDDWKAALINWFTDLKNSCPLFDLIGNIVYAARDMVRDALANIKYWYECEGGKEKVAFALAIAGAIVAVLLFIAALPASGFFAICAAIGAAIAAINAITNVFTSYEAMRAAENGDPAWAKIYGGRDKLSDVLREHNFKDGFLNRLTNMAATGLDLVEFVVGVINIVHGISEIKSKITCIQNYFDKNNGGLFTYFKEAEWHEVLEWDADGQHAIGTKWEMVTNDKGIVQTKFTLRSIWRGTKAFVLNQPVTPHSDQGLRTVLNQNFVIDFKTTFKTYLSPQSWKDTFRYHFTDGGRNTVQAVKSTYSWQGFKDTIRYTIKNDGIRGVFQEGLKWKDRAGYIKSTAQEINSIKSTISTIEKIATGKYDIGKEFREKVFNTSDFYKTYQKIDKKVGEFTNIITNSYPYKAAVGV